MKIDGLEGEWELFTGSSEQLGPMDIKDVRILKRIPPAKKSLYERINSASNYNESTLMLCQHIEQLEQRVEELERKR